MLENQNHPPRRYRAFLLRLWQEAPGQPWRALLQDATTQERYGFADLDCLLDFLHTQTGQDNERIEEIDR